MPGPPLVAWPDLDLFRTWMGEALQATDGEVRAEIAFAAAYSAVWERLNPRLLPENAPRPLDGDGFPAAPVANTCPADVRQAILLQANRLFTRRDSATGVLAFAEYGVRLSRLDPDVASMIEAWTGGAEPV